MGETCFYGYTLKAQQKLFNLVLVEQTLVNVADEHNKIEFI